MPAGNANVGQGRPDQTPCPQAVGSSIPTATACARRGKHAAFLEQPPLTLKLPLEERRNAVPACYLSILSSEQKRCGGLTPSRKPYSLVLTASLT